MLLEASARQAIEPSPRPGRTTYRDRRKAWEREMSHRRWRRITAIRAPQPEPRLRTAWGRPAARRFHARAVRWRRAAIRGIRAATTAAPREIMPRITRTGRIRTTAATVVPGLLLLVTARLLMPPTEATVPIPHPRIVRAGTVDLPEAPTAVAVAVAAIAPEDRTADIAKRISIDRKDRRRSTRAAFFLLQKAYRDRYPARNRP